MEPRVLLIDDDEDVRDALARTLSRGGCSVMGASGGASALSILRSEEVDVVICDYDMPGMNGMNLLQLVRLSYPDIVRVLLTGRATTQLAVQALNEHTAHRFLIKPWEGSDIGAIIQIALRSYRSGSPKPVAREQKC